MNRCQSRLISIIFAGAFLASCASVPGPVPQASAPEPHAIPYRWTTPLARRAHTDMVAAFGRVGLAPGEYVWASSLPKAGEARIIIDRLTQMAYAYRGDTLVGAASVSSAKAGKITPLGTWTVLEKQRMHRSRKYNDAAMPFMQRFDEYGTALHGGANPGYPASHGCVRMPMKFAEKVYALTKRGSPIIIVG